MAKKSDEHQVAYRVGGSDRFRWRLVQRIFESRDAALSSVEELKRMGYKAIVSHLGGFRHGLPETFEADENPDMFELRDGWLCRK